MAAVEPFPLVPAMWIEGRAFSGWPAASAKLSMRSRPNLLDRFRREHSQLVTVSILCKSGTGGMARQIQDADSDGYKVWRSRAKVSRIL